MSQPDIFQNLIFIFILVCLSAFFSASEAAFISLNKYHIQKFSDINKEKASPIEFWIKYPEKILITILVGNNIVNILVSIIAAITSEKLFHRTSIALITGIMIFIILVFGEIIPKSIGKRHCEKFVRISFYPIKFLSILLNPVIKFLIFVANFFVLPFGQRINTIMPVITKEDVKAMIEAGEEEGVIEEEEKEMIHSIFEIGDKMVKEIMIPRVKIVGVEENTKITDVIKVIEKEGYSRIPVYKNNIDKIVGIVIIKDIVAQLNKEGSTELMAKDIMRDVFFVPKTKRVLELLRDLQNKKLQMAIVVDEYGGTSGLITMEDLVEEIVGEISDEYKKDTRPYHKLPDGSFLVQGSMEIEKFEEIFDFKKDEDSDVETIAGFILDYLGKFPKTGEKFTYNNFEFTIQESDEKNIKWIKVKKIV
ncbi:MAG TPA: hemolysin family protein [bacterium]|nr:hemolysin family protein [bacterium]